METAILPKIFSFPIALGISALLTLSLIDLSKKLGLFDANNHLKQHREKVCSLGGISIFVAFWMALCLTPGLEAVPCYNHLFAGSALLLLVGVKDDLVGVPPFKRLFFQIGTASIMFMGGIRLTYLPGLEMELPLLASYLLTIVVIGAVVNAFNFIDGINGLAGGLSAIASFAFSVLFYISGLEGYAIAALTLAGAILGFLWFNFGQARIFMGDNGSTLLGVILSFFVISFLENHVLNGGIIEWHPALVLAILSVPIMDMIKVILGRLLRGASPFMGDRTHIHHLFLGAGLEQKKICYFLFLWSISVIILFTGWMPINIIAGGLVLLAVGSLPYFGLDFFLKNIKKKVPQLPAAKASEMA